MAKRTQMVTRNTLSTSTWKTLPTIQIIIELFLGMAENISFSLFRIAALIVWLLPSGPTALDLVWLIRQMIAWQINCLTDACSKFCNMIGAGEWGWGVGSGGQDASGWFWMCNTNQQTRELISARKTSHKHNNKDLSRLRKLSPGIQYDITRSLETLTNFGECVSRFLT